MNVFTEDQRRRRKETELAGLRLKPLFGADTTDGFKVTRIDLKTAGAKTWEMNNSEGFLDIWLNLKNSFRLKNNIVSKNIEDNSITFVTSRYSKVSIQFEGNSIYKCFHFKIGKEFISKSIPITSGSLSPITQYLLSNRSEAPDIMCSSAPLMLTLREFATALERPPIMAVAKSLFYTAKTQELLAYTMFDTGKKELFCSRQKRVTNERVSRIKRLLKDQMAEPPTLKQMAESVGCSQYYMSRIFSKEAGMTIPQYLREIRIEHAAELLRTGQCNVTEAAFEVGYNSPSHFSQAFCQKLGVCPALYSKSLGSKAE